MEPVIVMDFISDGITIVCSFDGHSFQRFFDPLTPWRDIAGWYEEMTLLSEAPSTLIYQ